MQGSLDTAFLLGDKHLYIEGWLAAPQTRVDAAALIDASGDEKSAACQAYFVDRPDVNQAMSHLAAQGLAIAGFSIILELDSSPVPKSVALKVGGNHRKLTFDLKGPLSVSYGAVEKLNRLMAIPDAAIAMRYAREFGLALAAIDRFTRMASGGFLLEGWYFGSAEHITEARLQGILGETLSATQQLSLNKRADVEDVFAGRVPPEFICRGFRVRFDAFNGSTPSRLILVPDRGEAVVLTIPQSSAPPEAVKWKPPEVAASRATDAKAERISGEILAWWHLPDKTVVAIGSLSGSQPVSIQLEAGRSRIPVPLPGFLGRTSSSTALPPIFVLRSARVEEKPTCLKLNAGDGTSAEMRFPGVANPLNALMGCLVDIYGRVASEAQRQSASEVQRFGQFLVPLIEELRTQASLKVQVIDEISFGTKPSQIDVSIMVHSERCLPALHHIQLLSLWHRSADVQELLITTTADAGEDWIRFLSRTHQMFGVRARLLVLSRCPVATIARCLAAPLARGRFLCFLASDIVADSESGLSKLLAILETEDNIGALGATILYPDGALFQRELGLANAPLATTPYALSYPGRGLSPTLLGTSSNRNVAGVGGGLLLTAARHFRRVGGFDEAFFNAEVADLEFCLKLRRAGLRVLCEPTASFTCFESDVSRQSCIAGSGELAFDLARLQCRLNDQERAELSLQTTVASREFRRNAS